MELIYKWWLDDGKSDYIWESLSDFFARRNSMWVKFFES